MNVPKRSVMAAFLLLLGLMLLFWPSMANRQSQTYHDILYHSWKSKLEQTDISRQKEQVKRYNTKLMTGTGNLEKEYDAITNFQDGILGFLFVPKIDLMLPIFHGVEEESLKKGVGHLPASALPGGGEGNHTVLTGHTGLPETKLLTDLTKLTLGDSFFLEVLDETLEYRVDQIKVVLPGETEDLLAVSHRDYCTLVTCTPYGINSHRLLVRGERVE